MEISELYIWEGVIEGQMFNELGGPAYDIHLMFFKAFDNIY